MNYIILIIIGIIGFAAGWIIANFQANEKLLAISEAVVHLEESDNVITVEAIQYLNAASEIEILINFDNKDIDKAEEIIVDSLGQYYAVSKEAIEDGMASDEEKDIVTRIDKLSEKSELFQKVVNNDENTAN